MTRDGGHRKADAGRVSRRAILPAGEAYDIVTASSCCSPRRPSGHEALRAADAVGLVHTMLLRYVTAKHGLIGLAKVVAKEGGAHGVRANVICPGFVCTPLADKQIPEQAAALGISEADVIKNVMLDG